MACGSAKEHRHYTLILCHESINCLGIHVIMGNICLDKIAVIFITLIFYGEDIQHECLVIYRIHNQCQLRCIIRCDKHINLSHFRATQKSTHRVDTGSRVIKPEFHRSTTVIPQSVGGHKHPFIEFRVKLCRTALLLFIEHERQHHRHNHRINLRILNLRIRFFRCRGGIFRTIFLYILIRC